MDEVKEEIEETIACDIKVEIEESAEECYGGLVLDVPSNPNGDIQIKVEDDETTIKMEVEQSQIGNDEWLSETTIKEENVYSDNENCNNKYELSEKPDPSSTNSNILKGLLIEKNINCSSNIELENESALLSNSEHEQSLDEENETAEAKAVEKFRVNMSAIESVSKENQVSITENMFVLLLIFQILA